MTFLLYFLLNCLKCLIQILDDIIEDLDEAFKAILYFLLNCLKCLIQILNDIIDIFCTDRKTDRVWLDSLI